MPGEEHEEHEELLKSRAGSNLTKQQFNQKVEVSVSTNIAEFFLFL